MFSEMCAAIVVSSCDVEGPVRFSLISKYLEPDCEIMVCDLQASNAKKTALVLCYRPPSFDNEFFCTAMQNTLLAE